MVSLDGFIGPLNGVAGVSIDVRGKDVRSEPAVRNALPRTVDRALHIFDPDGQGIYPRFDGDFACHIVRPQGQRKRWQIDLDVNLLSAEGKLAVFPYPIRNMTGRLEVHEGIVNVVNARMRRGDASVAIDGKVTWKTSLTPASTQLFGPDLHVVAQSADR